MGMSSYLYLSEGSMPSIKDIENILNKEGYTIENVVPFITNHFPNYINSNYFEFEYAYFDFDNGYYLMVYPYNYISGGDRNKTEPYTISGNVNDFTHKLLKTIASYYGGHFEANGCDESIPEDWIPKTKSLNTVEANELENLIYSKVDYKEGSIIYNFLKENEELLTDYYKGSLK